MEAGRRAEVSRALLRQILGQLSLTIPTEMISRRAGAHARLLFLFFSLTYSPFVVLYSFNSTFYILFSSILISPEICARTALHFVDWLGTARCVWLVQKKQLRPSDRVRDILLGAS